MAGGRASLRGRTNLLGVKGIHEVLLVAEDKHGDVGELVLLKQLAELDSCLLDAPAVCAVDHVHLIVDKEQRGLGREARERRRRWGRRLRTSASVWSK